MHPLGDGTRFQSATSSIGGVESALPDAVPARPLPGVDPPVRGRLAAAFIRTVDIVVALTVLIVTAPLLVVIAVLIKRDSPGPVLFRHVRIGTNKRRRTLPVRGSERRAQNLYGKPFALYKFRTMQADARERFPELYEYRYDPHELHSMPIKVLVSTKLAASGPGVQPAAGLLDDPRLTQVGRWLRRTSLDELPNMFNVLRGDMHLVGPRPDIYENIRYYESQHLAKLGVRPGVTGLAQVQGRGNLSFHETNEWDLEYLRTRSVWLDLKILAKTLWVSMRGDGAF